MPTHFLLPYLLHAHSLYVTQPIPFAKNYADRINLDGFTQWSHSIDNIN